MFLLLCGQNALWAHLFAGCNGGWVLFREILSAACESWETKVKFPLPKNKQNKTPVILQIFPCTEQEEEFWHRAGSGHLLNFHS